MRGDIVYRIYGRHQGRVNDSYFGTFRTRAEAEAEIANLVLREMHGQNWAAQYHNEGFVVREHAVATDFEVPTRPKPRDRYAVEIATVENGPGVWASLRATVLKRTEMNAFERICEYERDYPSMYQAFEPFRQAGRELALVSRHYTRAAVLDLASGKIIAEETEDPPGSGFCPIGFYVPDWWDIHDASTIPGSEYWNADDEWPLGDFGFVWGCHWGDDTSWKVQYLDLRRVHDGIIGRDDRFGYVKLATTPTVGSASLIFDSSTVGSAHATPSLPPAFIDVQRHAGKTRVRFNVELDFDLESGVVDADDLSGMNRSRA